MIKADKEGQRKAPILRFKGFTDAWEQRQLKEVADIVGGGTPSTDFLEYWNGNINWFTPNEINSQIYFSESKRKISNLGLKKSSAKLLPANRSILFTSRATIGEMGILTQDATTNQGFQSLVLHNEVIPYFIFSMKSALKKQAIKKASGSTFLEISKREVEKLKIIIPSEKEQKKVSMLFKSIDNLITLYERKLKLLSQVKKYFLDNLFTEKEYPNLRFKGFTDAWEQRKLGQVGKTQSGVGFPNEEQGGLEGIPFFKVSDMNNPGNEYEMVNANNYVKDDQLARKKWHPIKSVPAVIFAKVGAAIMLNRKRLVTRPFLIDNNSMAYIFDDSWDINFGKNIFETINLPRYAQVGALPSYNGSDIQGIKIFLPRKNEQSKIGIFIMTINEIITLYENKQQHLTKIKKTLLNTMFI